MSTIRLSYRSILRAVLVPLVALAVALGGIEHPAGAATLKPHTDPGTITLYDNQGGWSLGHYITVDATTLPAPFDQYSSIQAWWYTCTTNTAPDPATSSDCTLKLSQVSAYPLDYYDSGKYLIAKILVWDMVSQTTERFTTQYSDQIAQFTNPCTTSVTVCDIKVTSVTWSTMRLSWDAPNLSSMPGATVGGYVVKQLANSYDYTGTTVCNITDPAVRTCDVTYTSGNGTNGAGINSFRIIPRIGAGSSFMDGQVATVQVLAPYQPQIAASISSTSLWFWSNPSYGYALGSYDKYSWEWTIAGKTCQVTYSNSSDFVWTVDAGKDCASWTPGNTPWTQNWDTQIPLSPDTTYPVTAKLPYNLQVTLNYGYSYGLASTRSQTATLDVDFSIKTLAQDRPNPTNFSVTDNGDGTYTTSYDVPSGTAPDGSNLIAYSSSNVGYGGYCVSGEVTSGSTRTCNDFTLYGGAPGSSPITPTVWYIGAVWMETSRLTVGTPGQDISTLYNPQAGYNFGFGRGWIQVSSGSWATSDGKSSSNPNGTGGGSGGGGGSSTTAPGAPTGVTATAGDGQATVTWTAPSSTGGASITGYTVQYSSDGGSTWTTASCSGTSTSCTITGLTNGTNYVFKVAATNSAGTGSYSSNSSSVSPAASGGSGGGGGGGSSNTAPGSPSGINTTATDTSVTVSWTAPTNNGGSSITGYTVTIKDGSGNVVGTCTTTTATSCTVSPLTPGASYVATVVANNAQGAGTSATKSFSATNTAGKKAKRYYIRRYQKGQLGLKAKQIKQIKKAVTAIVKSGATTIRITGWSNTGAKKIKSTTRAVNVTKVVNKQLATLKATNIQVTTVGGGGTKRFGGTVLNRVVVIRGK